MSRSYPADADLHAVLHEVQLPSARLVRSSIGGRVGHDHGLNAGRVGIGEVDALESVFR